MFFEVVEELSLVKVIDGEKTPGDHCTLECPYHDWSKRKKELFALVFYGLIRLKKAQQLLDDGISQKHIIRRICKGIMAERNFNENKINSPIQKVNGKLNKIQWIRNAGAKETKLEIIEKNDFITFTVYVNMYT